MGWSMAATVCAAKASYKKLPGLLELTDTHLQWTQDAKKVPSITLAYAEAASLFCSKESAPQVKMKVTLVDKDVSHTFTFSSPQAVAIAEREKFKQALTAIISSNRSGSVADGVSGASSSTRPPPIRPLAAPTTAAPSTSSSASKAPPVVAAATPAPSIGPRALAMGLGPQASAGMSRSISRTPAPDERRGTPLFTGSDPANEFRLRKKVLMSNPELGALHRDLVMTGQITEAEFWDGREHLTLAAAAAEAQKKGKPGQLVDPRPEAVEGGEIKIRITPQLVHDIFDEYPVVARAYSENVPAPLSEEQFWKRYFQSKLFNAHRASIRSSAAQHVVKDDPIFDKYLERDDDEVEPRRQRNEHVEVFVDLAATLEDHEETGNEKDVTMRAGRQKAALPLIRKFNEHSERLLNSALGEVPPTKRRRLDHGRDEYAQIDIEDLHDSEESAGIILEMQDRQRYFEGRMAAAKADAAGPKKDYAAAVRDAKASLQRWDVNLAELKIERKPGDAALISMTQNVVSRQEVRSKKNEIPDGLFRQMTTCQTAANEFLRQFWLATYPPPGDASSTAFIEPATPAQRAAKAAKMIAYIAKTQEKVAALVQVAASHGIDAKRVEVAMNPIVQASNRALMFYQSQNKGRF